MGGPRGRWTFRAGVWALVLSLPLIAVPCAAAVAGLGDSRTFPYQADGVAELLAKLKKSPNSGEAGIHATDLLRNFGADGRTAVLGLLADATVAAHTIEGILSSLRIQRDAADDVLAALEATLRLRRDADTLIHAFLRNLDDHAGIFGRVVLRLTSESGEQTQDPLLRMLAFLVDTDLERMQAIEQLVICLEKGPPQPVADVAHAALRDLSLRQFSTAALARAWFDAFRVEHSTGFSVLALHRSAVREFQGRAEEEARLAIGHLVKENILPIPYLDTVRYGPGTRLQAIEGMAAAIGSNADRRRRAGERLTVAVDQDPDGEVRRAALRVLLPIARSEETIRGPLAQVLFPLVTESEDVPMLTLVVAALSACQVEGTSAKLAALFNKPSIRQSPEASKVRGEILTALVSLKQGNLGVIREALVSDPDPVLRRAAVRSLASTPEDDKQRADVAQYLATALGQEKDADVRRVIVASLRSVPIFSTPEIRGALLVELQSSATGSSNQAEVLKTLMRACVDLAPNDRAEVEAALAVALPAGVADRVLREELARSLVASKGWPRDLVVSWLSAESDPIVRTIFLQAWSAATPLPPTQSLAVVSNLIVRDLSEDALPILLPLIGQLRAEAPGEVDAPILEKSVGLAVRSYALSQNVSAAESLLKEVPTETPGFHRLLGRAALEAARGDHAKALELMEGAAKASEGLDDQARALYVRDHLRILEAAPRSLLGLEKAVALYEQCRTMTPSLLSASSDARWKLEADLRGAVGMLSSDATRDAGIATLGGKPDWALTWLADSRGALPDLIHRLNALRQLFPACPVQALPENAGLDEAKAALKGYLDWSRTKP